MATVTTTSFHTPESLLAMPDNDAYELIDGNLVERNMGSWSSYVNGRIFALLWTYNEAQQRGHVFCDGPSYQCYPDAPTKVRRPDTSFIQFGRLANEEIPIGHITIAPDLVVEVLSPNDTAYEIAEKVDEYLAAGVSVAWVINPASESVEIHQSGLQGTILRASDELRCDSLLPGFRCRVSALFEVKTPNQQPS